MASSKFDPQKHLPLSPAAFSILMALCDGEKHGYAILRDVNDKTQGAVLEPLPGTLYNLLKRMLDYGSIRNRERPDPQLDDELMLLLSPFCIRNQVVQLSQPPGAAGWRRPPARVTHGPGRRSMRAKALSLSIQVYACLVRLYPPAYHGRFEREITRSSEAYTWKPPNTKGQLG